jgi:hypothetical protein
LPGRNAQRFQIAELVEQKQRMVTGAAIMAVPDAHLLFAMGRTDARIHVEHDAARRTPSMNEIDPLSRKIGKGRKVLFGGEPSSLEAAHLARWGGTAMSRLTADDPAHRRIMAQTLGVVHIFVSGKAAKHGLPQHSDESVPAILAGPCVREAVAGHRGQAERVIDFPVGQQSGIRGHDGAAKLEHQTAVEIEPENLIIRFTRRVRHGRFFKSNIIC